MLNIEEKNISSLLQKLQHASSLTGAQTHLVGGCVRDALMGVNAQDLDYVVVNATESHLLAQGFFRIGKSFPVFMHPQDPDKQEFAMARTEKKSGVGHTGFETQTDNVSIELDLLRRDLTINAMALTEKGQIIDPYGGMDDIQQRVLRHTSEAFADDPLRVLRLARFAARYGDFSIAPETIALCRKMCEQGELNHLTAERIWKELSRALMEPAPQRFIEVLHACGALAIVLPEVEALFGVPQTEKYHPEVDTGIHILLCLAQAAKLNAPLHVRYAMLVHDLGKGITDPAILPKHHGHEEAGVPLVEAVNARFRVPANIAKFAVFVCRNHLLSHQAEQLTAKRITKLIDEAGGAHAGNVLPDFLLATQCDAQGRLGLSDLPYPARRYLLGALAAYRTVNAKEHVYPDNPILTRDTIHRARVTAVNQFIKQANASPVAG